MRPLSSRAESEEDRCLSCTFPSPHLSRLQEALRRLTDFGAERAESWPNVDVNNLTVHDRGEGWAEVTEGNKIAWERER